MLAADDVSTTKAIQRLLRIVRTGERPVVLWVGAGVSGWAGYPLWPALAGRFHTEYVREIANYNANGAALLLGRRSTLSSSLFVEARIEPSTSGYS